MSLKSWIWNNLWWRLYYHKSRLTKTEAESGHCLLCQAHTQLKPSYNYPLCGDVGNNCPCKDNERLILINE